MSRGRIGLALLALSFAAVPAGAQSLDTLQGKFAFNWHSRPAGQKCVKVADRLFASFKSSAYNCDLEVKTNTSSGAGARTCTEVKGGKEYLIFDNQRACERERKEQASNE